MLILNGLQNLPLLRSRFDVPQPDPLEDVVTTSSVDLVKGPSESGAHALFAGKCFL